MIRQLFWLAALLGAFASAAPAHAGPVSVEQPPRTASAQARFDALVAAAKSSMMSDPSEAVTRAQAAYRLARTKLPRTDRKIAVATAEWLAGEAHLRLDELDQARPLVDTAWRAVRGQRTELAGDILLSRGGVHTAIPDVAAALADYQEAFRIFRHIGNARSQARALLMIAGLYVEAEDYRSALRYYEQAFETHQGDNALLLPLYNGQGNALRALRNFGAAKRQFEQAFRIARELGSKAQQARILRNIARTQIDMGDLDAASRTVAQGMALTEGADRIQFLSISAVVAQMRGQNRHAADLLEQALRGVDLATTTLAFRDTHQHAYEVYKNLGRFDLALEHLEAVRRLDEQTSTLAASTNTALMAARFDYTNQNLKIAKLQAEDAARQLAYERAQARYQQTIFVALGIATLIVVALLVAGLLAIRRSRNQVRAANIELAGSNAALSKALAAKTEFLATTSHEIRTPLNGILGMTQVMLADQAMPVTTRERIEVVHSAGVTMRALVDDILDVAKMETGNMTVEHVPLDLCAILHDVSRLWEDQAAQRGLSFTVDVEDCPAIVLGDPARLRQIVFNLLGNALKFTSAGGVTLRAGTTEEEGVRRMQVSVSDTGIGIAPDKLHDIFESFRQADTSTTRQFGGTGLGLAICRNLARAMNGDVFVESVEGKGSTFTLDLPLAEPAADAGDAGADDGSEPGGLLIVEANPITRSMLRALMAPHEPAIEAVGSFGEACATLRDRCVARVVLDEGVVADQGEASAAVGRLVAACPTAEFTLLWSAVDPETLAALERLGSVRLIRKPISGTALRDVLYPCNAPAQDTSPLVSRAA